MNNPPNKRLLSLDILRGITIAGMIMVNNPGSWGHIYAPLGHAEWIGLTPTDLVFPFFMFIMGISTYMSLRKFDFRLSGAVAWKIIRRTIVIFAIGLAIAWFGLTMRTSETTWPPDAAKASPSARGPQTSAKRSRGFRGVSKPAVPGPAEAPHGPAVLDTRAALGPPASSGCEKGCESFAASSHNRSFSQ